MQKYINYLLADIEKAINNQPPRPYFEIDEDEEVVKGAIEYLNMTPKPMEQWFRIEKMNFPPINKLSVEQTEALVEAILKLWDAFNFAPVFPENLPIETQYELLVKEFSEPVVWVSQGTTHIEFCDYDTDNCPFTNEFCMCKDLDLDDDQMSDNLLGEDNPF